MRESVFGCGCVRGECSFIDLSKWFSERKNDPKTNGKLLANEFFCVLLPRLPRHLSRNRSEVNVAIFYSDEMPCWLFVAIGPIGSIRAKSVFAKNFQKVESIASRVVF